MKNQQAPPLDPKSVQDILIELRKQVSRVDGEVTTMKTDAMSGVFNSFSQILKQLFSQKAQAEAELSRLQKTLDDIYQGHPEIKIAMEKKETPPKSKK